MEDVLQWILTLKNKNNEIYLKKELPLIGIVLAPFIIWLLFGIHYRKVPTHWNYKGEVDKWEINIH
jgi:hypothetical protein